MLMPFKYTITDKLLSNIKSIAQLVTKLNSTKFSDIVLMEYEKIANIQSSYSSTSIEGNPLPVTEVKKLIKNHPKNMRNSEKEVVNYNNILMELNKNLGTSNLVFNSKTILSIHKKLMTGLIDKARCGRLRFEPVFVNNPQERKTIYWPPDHKDVLKLMEKLIDFVISNKGKIDPLIIAGIFHKQFVIIHPFIDGNGRTVRLATKLLLAEMGLNTFNLFSFENYYNNNVSKYFEQVGVLGNYYDIQNKTDFTSWLEYFTDGIIDELLRVGKQLENASASPDTILTEHLALIMKHIEEKGFITDKEYSKITKRSKPSRNLDFNKLIRLGHIERVGKGKATYYRFSSSGN